MASKIGEKMKLWEKGLPLDQAVEQYTVGEDPILDLELIPFDCQGSIAHGRMLASIGVLTQDEFKAIEAELTNIKEAAQKGEFAIDPSQEDGHTAIENCLVKALGDTGYKIHTGRSRNDQVLTAWRLLLRDRLQGIDGILTDFAQTLKGFSAKFGDHIIPGYTHTRKAMPMSTSTWCGALHDSMEDNRTQLASVIQLINQSPLGTGAGFGVPISLDREMTASELGFDRIQKNPVYTQNSRVKFDSVVLNLLSMIMMDLNKFSSDLIFFTQPELNLFSLPDSITTGSSIMPQKKNPDVLELIRANYHSIIASEIQAKTLNANLISGYHRDFQLLKGTVLKGLSITQSSLTMMDKIFSLITLNPEACKQSLTPELFATEQVYDLVKKGMPFRLAYKKVAHAQLQSK